MDFLEDGGVPASQANKTTMSVHHFDDLEAEQKFLQNGSDSGLALSLGKLCHLLIRVVCKHPFQTKPPTSHNASPAHSENPQITSRKLLQWVESSKNTFSGDAKAAHKQKDWRALRGRVVCHSCIIAFSFRCQVTITAKNLAPCDCDQTKSKQNSIFWRNIESLDNMELLEAAREQEVMKYLGVSYTYRWMKSS
jgi:hypothetical protein